MNRVALKQIKNVQLDDLVRTESFDASVGKSLRAGGAIDISVKSWGVYVGVLGEKNKHIILAPKQLLDNTHNHASSQINNPSVSTSLNISQPVSTSLNF